MPRKTRRSTIYQIKIGLRHSQPRVWRRVQLAAETTLPQLHTILQVVMGWEDYHLHEFIVRRARYGVPDDEFELGVIDEREIPVNDVLIRPGHRLTYVYDFGDNWQHTVSLEAILDYDPTMHYPICVGGKRACPPEDVGGMNGYEEFLEALADPSHSDHEQMRMWIGGYFDPAAFDPNQVNRCLRHQR